MATVRTCARGLQLVESPLKRHEDLVGAELAKQVRGDERFRTAFCGQFQTIERLDFQKRFGLDGRHNKTFRLPNFQRIGASRSAF